jgi:hypothetical protein
LVKLEAASNTAITRCVKGIFTGTKLKIEHIDEESKANIEFKITEDESKEIEPLVIIFRLDHLITAIRHTYTDQARIELQSRDEGKCIGIRDNDFFGVILLADRSTS